MEVGGCPVVVVRWWLSGGGCPVVVVGVIDCPVVFVGVGGCPMVVVEVVRWLLWRL